MSEHQNAAEKLPPVVVTVTERMIRDGIACDCRDCPVARAFDEVLTDGFIAIVDGYSAEICKESSRNAGVHIPLPLAARYWIARFDNGKTPVALITLQVPRELFPPGALKEGV